MKPFKSVGILFTSLKILVEHKILSDGLHNSSFDIYNTGEQQDALDTIKKYNEPGTVVINLRNQYEHEAGHFQNYIIPESATYKESVPIIEDMLHQINPVYAILYCRCGIIRREKFSACLKHQGGNQVFQLKGVVINYAHQSRELGLESKFTRMNFVFDERTVEWIRADVIARCQ